MYKEQLCKLLRKFFENFSIFLRKCNFFMTGSCIFVAKTQKQTIFKENLFGNFYSTLDSLSNGIKHCKILLFKKKSNFENALSTRPPL